MCNWPPCWPHSWIAVQVIKGNHLLQIRFLPLIIYLFLSRHGHMPVISFTAYHLLPLLYPCLFFTFFCSQGLEQWVKTPPFTVFCPFLPAFLRLLENVIQNIDIHHCFDSIMNLSLSIWNDSGSQFLLLTFAIKFHIESYLSLSLPQPWIFLEDLCPHIYS